MGDDYKPQMPASIQLTTEELLQFESIIARAVGAIRASGGYGKVDLTFEAGKLAYSNLNVATSYKTKKSV